MGDGLQDGLDGGGRRPIRLAGSTGESSACRCGNFVTNSLGKYASNGSVTSIGSSQYEYAYL